jgi:ferredoxin
MIRKIIKIDEEKCTGCGLCADACHEGAIGMVNGKAKLLRDDYCDGLGNCLPACPTGAITFEEREAKEYSEAAVKAKNLEKETRSPLRLPRHYVEDDTPFFTGKTDLHRFVRGCEPFVAVAGSDQTCARERTVFRRRRSFDRS